MSSVRCGASSYGAAASSRAPHPTGAAASGRDPQRCGAAASRGCRKRGRWASPKPTRGFFPWTPKFFPLSLTTKRQICLHVTTLGEKIRGSKDAILGGVWGKAPRCLAKTTPSSSRERVLLLYRSSANRWRLLPSTLPHSPEPDRPPRPRTKSGPQDPSSKTSQRNAQPADNGRDQRFLPGRRSLRSRRPGRRPETHPPRNSTFRGDGRALSGRWSGGLERGPSEARLAGEYQEGGGCAWKRRTGRRPGRVDPPSVSHPAATGWSSSLLQVSTPSYSND